MKTVLISCAAFGLAAAVPAEAATLIGQSIDYCTDSVRDGPVSNSPADCDPSVVSVVGSAIIADPGVEVILDQGGTRRLDFFADYVDVIYRDVGSFSPDLFVVYGITAPVSNVVLDGLNPLDVTWVYGGGALGVLVGAPLEDGIVRLRFEFADAGVPEPATWAMFIAGFGLVGGALRRRSALAAV